MASEPWGDPAVNYLCCRLADLLSRMLEPDEREIVRGDLAESNLTGWQATREVAGLVLRRQAALWREWHSWLALAGLIPLGLVLTLASRRTAYGNAIYIWLYANNWTWTYLKAGFREQFLSDSAGIVISWFALAGWSWTGGLLIGSLSRRRIWTNAALLFFGLLIGGLLRPHNGRFGTDPNAAVFALMFYRVVFPVAAQCAFVLVPSLAGMRAGYRTAALPVSLRTLLWICVIASMASLATQDSLWWQIRTWHLYPLRLPRLPSLQPLAIAGPIGYIVATAIFGRSRRRTQRTA
jgi:hypothetical protein